MASPVSREELLKKLDELGIETHTVEHPEVYTVEEALPHISDLPGVFAKNLFLKDKKKKLWLYCAPCTQEVKLSDLAREVGAPGGLRLADEDILFKTLGVRQGCVTVFGLINDQDHKVKLILDKTFWNEHAGSGLNASGADAALHSAEKQPDTREGGDMDAEGGKTDGKMAAEVCGSQQKLYFHPLVNNATTGITIKGLKCFLAHTGHEPVISC